MTTLSVLLPVYNAAPYLEKTLSSILTQTRQADQIIIINDGSSDRSQEIIENFLRREQRIEVFYQNNAGVSAARNRGLTRCEGDFIALMDADDICLPERFAIQLAAMQKQQIDLCSSWIRTFGRTSREVRYPLSDEQIKWNYLFFGRTLPNPATMMRRIAVSEVKYREDLDFAEDYGFFLEILLKRPETKFANIPSPLLHYRTHPQQASQRLQEKNQEAIISLLTALLPSAGIDASPTQIYDHYQVWQQRTPLSADRLANYLPLMVEICNWLALHSNRSNQLRAEHWLKLASLHRTQGSDVRTLITQSGELYRSSWRRLLETLRNRIG